MRLLVHPFVAVLLLAVLALPGSARAGAAQPGAEPAAAEVPAAPPEAQPAVQAEEKPFVRRLEPPKRPANLDSTEPRRPSGFWTSTRPAKGGAYRYRMLGIGVVLLVLTLAGMIWLVRRHTRSQPAAPE